MKRCESAPRSPSGNASAGAVYPVYHVLADIGGFAGGQVLSSRSSDPLEAECLALKKDDRVRLLLVANLTPEARSVSIACDGLSENVTVRMLDAGNVAKAMKDPEDYRAGPKSSMKTREGYCRLSLRPLAVACIDGECARQGSTACERL